MTSKPSGSEQHRLNCSVGQEFRLGCAGLFFCCLCCGRITQVAAFGCGKAGAEGPGGIGHTLGLHGAFSRGCMVALSLGSWLQQGVSQAMKAEALRASKVAQAHFSCTCRSCQPVSQLRLQGEKWAALPDRQGPSLIAGVYVR